MALICPLCSRLNPADASFCFHDGSALAGAGRLTSPGAVQFPRPFVFPNGDACRSYDQLAMGCQRNWGTSLSLLSQGAFRLFFRDLGRLDLAAAANEASSFPDPERGLDLLLAKMPGSVVEPPKLHVEPTEVNLGRLRVGQNHQVQVHLVNHGMRLLYGSMSSDAEWLAFSETAGQPQRLFQFCERTAVTVYVRGQDLRASFRPLEGHLVIDSSGGTATIPVRGNLPVTPFPEGIFKGAITPRHIAEKARASPKIAAREIERGQVSEWFKLNGWSYPVRGPIVSGLGGVQQFLEALGVAKPPPLAVTPLSCEFSGVPDTVFRVDLTISTPLRKVVYAWATANRYWVEVGIAKLTGRTAIIPVTIKVPDCKGVHEAKITVIGNGQQRFVVPASVAVVGGADLIEGELVEEP
jgi:hypothetical protein